MAVPINIVDNNGTLFLQALNTAFDETIQHLGTIAELRATVPTSTDLVISVTGYHTALDNIEARIYYWDSTSTATDDGCTVIKVSSITTGRWKIKNSGILKIKWFGAKGDGITDDTVAFQNASSFLVSVDDGTYLLTASVNGTWLFSDNVSFVDANKAKNWTALEAGGYMSYFDTRSNYQSISGRGGIGHAHSSRTSDNTRTGELNTIGSASYVNNDNTNAADKKSAWSYYGHAVQSEANKFTSAMEIDVCNLQTLVTIDPYSMGSDGAIAGHWVGVGGETAQQLVATGGGASIANSSAAIGIVNTASSAAGNRFKKGIIFQSNAIDGTDGITGTGTAIEFAKGHELVWKYSSGTNAKGGVIRSDNTDVTKQVRLIWGTSGLDFKGVNADYTTEVMLMRLAPVANAVNYLSVLPAITAGVPSINATGSDTNVSFRISTKGTGAIVLQSNSANAMQVWEDGTHTRVLFRSLPTSSAGLSAGEIYNDGGTLKIV